MKTITKFIIINIIGIYFCVNHSAAQHSACGISSTSDSNSSFKIIRNLQKESDQYIPHIATKYSGKLKEAYAKRNENIIKEIEEGVFYFSSDITDPFNTIFQQIVKSNPSLRNENLKLLVSRHPYPNAYCTGTGVIVFNLELLPWLENESQIAFVLCHEIAHHTLNHVNNATLERISHLYSEKTQKQLKKIKKRETGSYTQANNLLKGFVFEERRHSRFHEAEADSLALVYLENTPYNTNAAIGCLEQLDKVDGQRFDPSIHLQEIFHTDAYPFKEHWLEEEVGIFATKQPVEEWNRDSIKTHPDCSKRIQLLQTYLKESNSYKGNDISDQQEIYETLSFEADYELTQNTFLFQNWGRSLYYTLQLLKKHPTKACLHTMVSKNLYHIYTAQQNHVLDEYLEQPAPWHPKEYKTLLEFLQNLRQKELAQLNYQYLASNKDDFLEHPDFHQALILAAKQVKDSKELNTLQALWQERYPE